MSPAVMGANSSSSSAAAVPMSVPRKKVAIVGGGSAGISALWALNKTHHDVYLYEAAERLGGRAHPASWRHGRYTATVEAGFTVFHPETSPNLVNFLDKIKVKTAPSPLAFAVARGWDRGRGGLVEWAGSGLGALFAQRRRILSRRMWRMLFDLVRFNQLSLDLLGNDEDGPGPLNLTIGQYLERGRYSDSFRDDYLIPMMAAAWSTSPDECLLEFPAVTLVRFLRDHAMLSTISTRPSAWLTMADGARSYISAVMTGFPPNHLFLNTKVRHVRNTPDGRVRLMFEGGTSELFDHIILACHADRALAMIEPGATAREADILSHFRTTPNVAVLHSDVSLMPASRAGWSSWNYVAETCSSSSGGGAGGKGCLTYNLNILQNIPTATFGDVLLTLNPARMPDPAKIQEQYKYRHWVCTAEAVAAQARLPEIQNTRGISYAGGWTGRGSHEDAFGSGLAVARDHLGARLPFEIIDRAHAPGRRPSLGLVDWALRVVIALMQLLLAATTSLLASAGGASGRARGGRQALISGVNSGIRSGMGADGIRGGIRACLGRKPLQQQQQISHVPNGHALESEVAAPNGKAH